MRAGAPLTASGARASPHRSSRALTLACAAACFVACSHSRPPDAPPDGLVPVTTAPVARGPVDRVIRSAGSVIARAEWDLSFKVGGVLSRVTVREGDRVHKGQPLAELERAEIAAMAAQAHEAAIKAARDRDRARILREGSTIPPAQLEDAQTAASVTGAAAAAAEYNLQKTALLAPATGWVDRRAAEPGEVVAPGRPILHLSSAELRVRTFLSAREALGVRVGAPAAVAVDDLPGGPLQGRVTSVSHSAGSGTGTYQIDVGLDRAPDGLRAGLTAKVEVRQPFDAAAVVPIGALVDAKDGSAAVFTVSGGTARRVPVRIAFLQDDAAVLAAAPADLERVVVEGLTRVADGGPVRDLR